MTAFLAMVGKWVDMGLAVAQGLGPGLSRQRWQEGHSEQGGKQEHRYGGRSNWHVSRIVGSLLREETGLSAGRGFCTE